MASTATNQVVTMRQLLESGVHFGHQTRRWNPKMKRFIFTERNGIYIIDLQQSLAYIDRAYEFIKETVAQGGTVMFVGTKKQAQEAIAEQATRVGMPYVNQRWLGGMLTNFQTVHQRLQRLKELERARLRRRAPARGMHQEGAAAVCAASRTSSTKTLGGIRDMAARPDRGLDRRHQEGAPRRRARPASCASRSSAILDTNCDPDEVDYPIPGNDDAIRAVALLTRVVADAVADGLIARVRRQGRRRREAGRARPPTSRWPSGSASCCRADGRRGRRRRRPVATPRPTETPAAEATGAPPRPPSRRGRRGRRGTAAEAPAAEAAAEAPARRGRRRGRQAAEAADRGRRPRPEPRPPRPAPRAGPRAA